MAGKFEFAEKLEEYNSILLKVKGIVSKTDDKAVKELEKDLSNIESQKLLTVAFIGQYNAGKSTIISVLTNDKSIKIDADIATKETEDYIWNNNIILTDTPGICTDRKDHDEITYKKIKESDLLIYCLTSDLFDNEIIENFKKIAFDEHQKSKMMLVINKMSMEPGEYNTLTSNYKATLRESLLPYDFDDFTSSFMDAFDYIEGVNDNEPALIDLSHFNDFIENLNDFISKKNIWARFTTPLYKIISFIDHSIVNMASGSEDDKEYFRLLKRMENEIIREKENARIKCNSSIRILHATIISYSRPIIDSIGVEKIDFDNELKNIDENMDKAIEKAKNDIQVELEKIDTNLDEELKALIESDIGKYIFNAIEKGKLNIGNESIKDFTRFLAGFKIFDAGVAQGAKAIAGMDPVALKEVVIKVVHFCGGKFKPWGAIKLAGNIGKAAKFAGSALAALAFFVEAGDTVKEEVDAKKIGEAKKACYNKFCDIASRIEEEFSNQLNEYIKTRFDEDLLKKIRDMRTKAIDKKKTNDNDVLSLRDAKKRLEDILNITEES